MNLSWNTKKIKELYDYSSGLSKSADQFGFGYPFLSYKDVFHNAYLPETLSTLVNSTEIEQEKCSIKRGDVFLTRTSETTDELGMSSVALVDYPYATYNGFTKRLRPTTNEIHPEFAAYFYRSPYFRAQIISMASLITRASLNESNLDRLKITYPNKETQIVIGNILQSYDLIINSNVKKIRLLEKMASELYKEWFVRFRFPGHEAAKFVDGVPEGWEYHKLKDIADIVMGHSPESSYYNSDGEGLPFHQGVTNYGRRYVSNVEYCSVGKRYALPNSILFSVRAPVGRINLTREKVIIGRGLSALNHKLGKQSYLFYLLKSHFSVEDMIGNGSVFSSVTKSELEKQKLLIPPSNLIEMFSQIVEPMDDMINCLDMQVEMLRKTRDLLLPRLMSGKLSVEPLLTETA